MAPNTRKPRMIVMTQLVLAFLAIAAAGCGDRSPRDSEELQLYKLESARLEKMQAEKQELADDYEKTLRRVSQARQDLREIHQQRIDLRVETKRPGGIENMQSFEDDMEAELAPQLAKVRAEYDAAMQKLDRAIKEQEERMQRAKDRARI